MTPVPDAPVEQALAAFGTGRARIRREPSFTAVVHRISHNGKHLFLKRHGPGDAPRIHLAAALSDRLRRHGLSAPRFVPTTAAETYARVREMLFTLSEAAGAHPLSTLDLADQASARGVGAYLAKLHAALNSAPLLDPPLPSALWHDGDQDGRIAEARQRLRALPPSRQRRTMLDALAVVEQTPAARARLATVAERTGVVHGDFWPGNVLVGAPRPSSLAIIDLESACHAPLLLDVAHFADIGFRLRTGEIDIDLATTFARAYAEASAMHLEELRALPDLLVAARGCSILWLVERHLGIGPGPTDRLVENDRLTIHVVTRIANRWSDQLSTAPRSAALAPAER